MDKTYAPVTTAQELTEALAKCRAAQEKFATYTQEQVDKIFLAAATAANQMRIPLAKQAVAETGMGVVEDKVIKNHYAAEYIYNAYKDSKTCGVIEEDTAYGIQRIAEPIGVIAAVIPTTNPTSTAIFKTLISLKTRNGIIISPHPRAKKCTIAAAKVVLEAAVKAGAPEGIVGWIDIPNLELTNTLMAEADIILATGGPGMVKAAYSSGTPALGVGAGNTPAIIDDTADVVLAVNSIIHSKTFDNGMICASEQSVIVLDKVYKAVKDEFKKRGCYFLNKEETEKVRKTIIINGSLNAKIVGQKAHTIAALAGVDVPESTKIIIGEVESVDISEEFAHEKLSPVLAMYKAKTFDEAIEKAEHLIADGGYGHTSSIYLNATTRQDVVADFASRMKTCRILVNTPSSQGGIGDLYNFKLAPSLTLGCGSWGGNSVSENVGVKHLINIKTVAERRENMLWFRTPEKVYFKKGCMPVALDELKTEYNRKKAFIVTDSFLFKSGFTKNITDKLDELGIQYACFYDVAPDPTLGCAMEGVKQIRDFEPDVIIALGGGSPMDVAKAVGVVAKFGGTIGDYEGVGKVPGPIDTLIAVPTTAGTGSEVTVAAVITDEARNYKLSVLGPEISPTYAVLDPELIMTAPASVAAACGVDALIHAMESYINTDANPFSMAMAEKAMELIGGNIRKFVARRNDVDAACAMMLGSTFAGIAFANNRLGDIHAMSHPVSAFYHVAHGVANAVLMPTIFEFNALAADERYANIYQYITGKDAGEDFVPGMLCDALHQLNADLGIPACLADVGVQEDKIPQMAVDAMKSGNVTVNPRITTVKDVEALYHKAMYK